MKIKTAATLSLLLSLIMTSHQAQAKLGGDAKSVDDDAKALGAQVTIIPQVGYNTYEMVTAANTVHEYMNPNGVVFAVSWRGMSHADHQLLLGSYYQSHQAMMAQKQKPQSRRPVLKRTGSDYVYIIGGKMRMVHGLAYVPSLTPSAIDPEKLK